MNGALSPSLYHCLNNAGEALGPHMTQGWWSVNWLTWLVIKLFPYFKCFAVALVVYYESGRTKAEAAGRIQSLRCAIETTTIVAGWLTFPVPDCKAKSEKFLSWHLCIYVCICVWDKTKENLGEHLLHWTIKESNISSVTSYRYSKTIIWMFVYQSMRLCVGFLLGEMSDVSTNSHHPQMLHYSILMPNDKVQSKADFLKKSNWNKDKLRSKPEKMELKANISEHLL